MIKLNDVDKSYVPAHLAIEAMRDNGYKNTAYAAAELIDNSIQAEADYVQLLCKEGNFVIGQRTVPRLDQIAVLDNGIGMSIDVLRLCLQFGNGTRLTKSERTGIGRFGMGLPASSISQCTRVDVWSWKNGVENANHVFLDIEDIKERKSHGIPEPIQKPIPDIWMTKGAVFEKSGTLIVWSNLDRMMWTRGQTLIKHSELLIGRMYRKFLNDERIKIDFTIFNTSNSETEDYKKFALPNDPMYLMKKTSCPEPFDNEPMFEPLAGYDQYEKKFEINYKGEQHDLFVRFSHAKDEARTGTGAGGRKYGKHASDNLGISILRAERELELDLTLVNYHDPTERWWGIEVEFPPSLDELMGVSNNKQSARNFSDILGMIGEIKKLQDKGTPLIDIIASYEDEGDPRAPLIVVCEYINRQLHNQLRRIIKGQKIGSKSNVDRFNNKEVAKKATEVTEIRQEQGHVGQSDLDEKKPLQQRKEEIETGLIASGVDDASAKFVAETSVVNNLKYSFIEAPFEGDAFFTVRTNGGNIAIILNKSHAAYENLLEVLDDSEEDNSAAKLKKRLERASEGLKLLLAAWARYEDETPDGPRRDQIQSVRQDWGRYAQQFLRNYENL